MKIKHLLLTLLVLLVGLGSQYAIAQEKFFTPSQSRGVAGMAKQRTQINTLMKDFENIPVCSAGEWPYLVDKSVKPYVWACAGETDPEVGAQTTPPNSWCRSDGTKVVCDQPDPTGGGGGTLADVHGFAKQPSTDITAACGPNQALTFDAGSLKCKDIDLSNLNLGGGGLNVKLGELSDVTFGTPIAGDVLTFNGTNWINGDTTAFFAGNENDPKTKNFAKADPPNCNASGQVMTSDGTNLLCKDEVGSAANPINIGQLGNVASAADSAANGSLLQRSGTAWVSVDPVTLFSAQEQDPNAKTFAKTDLPTCPAGQVLTGNGTALTCTDTIDKAGTATNFVESDPSVHTAYKAAPPTCGANQVLKANGTSLSCVDADSSVLAFAKSPSTLPNCGANEVLKANGTALSCVTDAGSAAAGGALWVDNTTYISHDGTAAATTGTHGAGGVLGLAGAGSRSFYYPRKSAFRAGAVSGTEWNEALIGNYSFAFGQNMGASADNAVAIALNDQAGAMLAQNNTMAIMGGNLGIGTLTPSSLLEVAGNIETTTVTFSSDRNWKRNIHTLEDALANILKLRGVTYDWRTDEFASKRFPEGRQVGLIAQEVEAVFPELVHTVNDGKTVNYTALVAPLIEAVKAQQKRIDELEARLKELE